MFYLAVQHGSLCCIAKVLFAYLSLPVIVPRSTVHYREVHLVTPEGVLMLLKDKYCVVKVYHAQR